MDPSLKILVLLSTYATQGADDNAACPGLSLLDGTACIAGLAIGDSVRGRPALSLMTSNTQRERISGKLRLQLDL